MKKFKDKKGNIYVVNTAVSEFEKNPEYTEITNKKTPEPKNITNNEEKPNEK